MIIVEFKTNFCKVILLNIVIKYGDESIPLKN